MGGGHERRSTIVGRDGWTWWSILGRGDAWENWTCSEFFKGDGEMVRNGGYSSEILWGKRVLGGG